MSELPFGACARSCSRPSSSLALAPKSRRHSPKAPNNELIVGQFERRHQEAHTAAWFRADGSVTVASNADELETKPIASGTWKLEGDQLSLTYTKGDMCEAGVEGTYKVVLSKVGIRFTKVEDACERRAKIDGETWYRR